MDMKIGTIGTDGFELPDMKSLEDSRENLANALNRMAYFGNDDVYKSLFSALEQLDKCIEVIRVFESAVSEKE